MDNAQTTARSATVSRDTLETQITVSVCLDGTGKAEFDTGLPFLEHMLDQIARHGMVDLNIKANGDLHIDAHHTVCLLYTSRAHETSLHRPRDLSTSRMPSSA